MQAKRLRQDKKQLNEDKAALFQETVALKKTIAELKEVIAMLKSGHHDIRLEGTSQTDAETILGNCDRSPDLQKQMHQHDPTGTLAAFWKEQVSSNTPTLTVPIPLTLILLILCIHRWTGLVVISRGSNGTLSYCASFCIYGRRWERRISACWRKKRYCTG